VGQLGLQARVVLTAGAVLNKAPDRSMELLSRGIWWRQMRACKRKRRASYHWVPLQRSFKQKQWQSWKLQSFLIL